jgi:23S rRNA pseudouridine955/2504/2580 synthase
MTNELSKNIVNLYLVSENDENQRLDNLLTKLFKDVPKSHIYRIIRGGEVRVNKKRVEANYKVQLNDSVRIPPLFINKPSQTAPNYIPQANFPILFEDEYYLIINKPNGVACHGGSGISFGVIEQLRHSLTNLKFLELAHRLDRETSGVLILAKKRSALVQLQEIIRNGKLSKQYLALTCGNWQDQSKHVKLPLYKYVTKEGERRVKVDHENGQEAYTIFKVVQKFTSSTLVNANLKTGRTHQIRVHLQHLGHPIVGDEKYGDFELNKKFYKAGCKRMFLHAYKVEFIHPILNTNLSIEAPLPNNLADFLANQDK